MLLRNQTQPKSQKSKHLKLIKAQVRNLKKATISQTNGHLIIKGLVSVIKKKCHVIASLDIWIKKLTEVNKITNNTYF